jgi:putative FmdB family regulatory protein
MFLEPMEQSMPLYEYVCEQDGARIELLRPMSAADAPVEDPEGQGRVFRRVASTFAAQGQASPQSGGRSSSLPVSGGCCPCGKNAGACSRN